MNPFDKVDFVEGDDPNPMFPSEKELGRLFQACPPGSRYYGLLMFYLITGARRAQAAKPLLNWECIDFKNGLIRLGRQKRKKRIVPLHPLLRDILVDLQANPLVKKAHLRDDDYLYPFPFHPSHISTKIFKPLFRKAG